MHGATAGTVSDLIQKIPAHRKPAAGQPNEDGTELFEESWPTYDCRQAEPVETEEGNVPKCNEVYQHVLKRTEVYQCTEACRVVLRCTDLLRILKRTEIY